MAAPVEIFAEHDMVGKTENSHDQKRGRGDDLGPGVAEKRRSAWPGESVFRILVPTQKVGGIIGRKGELIKRMCEESRARIKVLDGPQGALERAVIITAKEDKDASISPAMDGLLRVHKRAVDGLDGERPTNNAPNTTRLLVASTQVGSLIGKHGATIKSIQEASKTSVRVLDQDLPPFALQDDRVVEIQGEASGVHKALELIASHLRKFLVDRSVLPLFEKRHTSMPNSLGEHNNMPPPQPNWGRHPQRLPPNAGGSGPSRHPQRLPPNAGGSGPSGFGGNPQFMAPQPRDKFYPPPELPPFEKQRPQHGITTYGRVYPPTTNQQAAQPIISKVTERMQIPLSSAEAVIGKAGASISYTRRASGASITVQETRGVRGEMTVELNGSATQVQTAQQLIRNFLAEAAAAPAPAQNTRGNVDQGYNSYPTQGSMYTFSANAGTAARTGGGYGSVYGTNYGYSQARG